MSKFNQRNSNKTENRSGYEAYIMDDRDHLVTAVLTTMFGEPMYYGSTDSEIVELAVKFAKTDPDFLARLTVYARREMNMRSVSHVLASVIAREAAEYTRVVLRNIIIRPDDITEIMSCYLAMYGKPFPNAMKREIASVIQKFNEYDLAKYNGGKKSLKLRDVLRITHPVPKDAETEVMFKKLLEGTLEVPYTWETELSAKGNKKEVWNELIVSGKVGYMALLRNLRNIVKCQANVDDVLRIISDPERVKKSRQLPFRFYSAYRTLYANGLMTDEIKNALENALESSIDNMEKIPGRTLIAIDVSGSMDYYVSGNSGVTCRDIASLLGAMASRICEDSVICRFDYSNAKWGTFGEKGYCIEQYGKYDSIIDIADRSFNGGGTDLSLPMKYALEEDPTRKRHPFDRIIYFSDNECNNCFNGQNKPVQGMADKYRKQYNKNFWVHAVDLRGYGTQQFIGKRFNLIAGWSESVLPFIMLAERGISTLSDAIAKYDI